MGIGIILLKDFKSFPLIKDESKSGIGVASIVVPLDPLFEHFGEEKIMNAMDE